MPIIGNYAVPCIGERLGYRVPAIGGERPAVDKDKRIARGPFLHIKPRAIVGFDHGHLSVSYGMKFT